MQNKTAAKIVNWILTIVILLLAAFVVVNVIIAKINKKPVYLFGYMFMIVATDSMTPELQVGDFIIAQYVPIETVHVGDNAIFLGSEWSGMEGKPIVHRVIKTEWINGVYTITTQGLKAGAIPDTPTTAVRFLGKQVWHCAFDSIKHIIFGSTVVVLSILIFVISKFILRTLKKERERAKAIAIGLEKARIENEIRAQVRAERLEALKREKEQKDNDK